MRQQAAGQRERGGRHRGHVQTAVRSHIPRVLHPWLVHHRKEADVSVLQGEGGPEAHLLESLGTTACLVRTAAGLDPLAGGVAAVDPDDCPGDQLGVGIGVVVVGVDRGGGPQSHCIRTLVANAVVVALQQLIIKDTSECVCVGGRTDRGIKLYQI